MLLFVSKKIDFCCYLYCVLELLYYWLILLFFPFGFPLQSGSQELQRPCNISVLVLFSFVCCSTFSLGWNLITSNFLALDDYTPWYSLILVFFLLLRLYFTKVKLGSPPREFNVQIDTGSDVLWVCCNSCNNCPRTSGLGVNSLSLPCH